MENQLMTHELMEKPKYVRWKKDKKCIVCGQPTCGRLCRPCFETKSNKGRYKRDKLEHEE